MSSGTTAIVVVVIIVVVVAFAAVALMTRRRRLQQQFGPEYDRVVEDQNGRLRAEAELTDRQRRVRKFDIKPLTDEARSRYTADWMVIQEKFVDSPQSAVSDAYALVTTVMKDRGYPIEDDEQVMADLSVEHAQTVGHFRSARAITMNAAAGDAATEDLRQAIIHYRALFADLLGTSAVGGSAAVADDAVQADSAGPAEDSYVAQTASPVAAGGAGNGRVTEPAPDTDPDGLVTGRPAEDDAEAPQRY
jgi:hypothetical protein